MVYVYWALFVATILANIWGHLSTPIWVLVVMFLIPFFQTIGHVLIQVIYYRRG